MKFLVCDKFVDNQCLSAADLNYVLECQKYEYSYLRWSHCACVTRE